MSAIRQRNTVLGMAQWLSARSCCWLLCLAATPALALSLGRETVLSTLGDPIQVEIEVLQWEDVDLQRVQVGLADRDDYERFDFARVPALDKLEVKLVGPDAGGLVKLLVSSREPVDEPYVELLLEMHWPGGAQLREYVLLFDLPGRNRLVAGNGSAPRAALQTAPAAAGGERVSYQVREGDGLWVIGQRFRPPTGVDNLYQVLLSLHDLNRAAFINGNITLLKPGSTLDIPTAADAAAFDAGTAKRDFEQRWQEGEARVRAVRRGETLPGTDGGDGTAVPPADNESERREDAAPPAAAALLLPAAMPVVEAPVEAVPPGTAPALATIVLRPEPLDGGGLDAAAVAEGSQTSLLHLLEQREQDVAQLQQQLGDMQQRLSLIEQAMVRLNLHLQEVLAERGAALESARMNTVLGGLALVLGGVSVGAMATLGRVLHVKRRANTIE